MRRQHTRCLAIAATLLALPAASQQGKTPPTNLFIDVATHNMAGMPDMGGMLGGLGGMMARRMGGGETSKPTYPTARHAGLTGQYLDIALHNTLKPGVEAQDLIPSSLNLGKSLTLIPVEPSHSEKGESTPGKVPDIEVKISEYWGCSATVRPGQPKVATFKVKGGNKTVDPRAGMAGMQGVEVQSSGSLSKGLYVPDRDIDLQPGYVYWPNRQYGKQVPSGARLAGDHQITGDGIPTSMKFQVQQDADFMPKLMLRSQGELTDAIDLSWPSVSRARGYFITGMHTNMKSQSAIEMVIWSSADVPGAGSELHAYLSGSQIEKWQKQKILMSAAATNCIIPKGIFASQGGGQPVPSILMMTAYGPESWITYPPKPADPKQPWNPEWSVRLRAKSTAFSMLGMNFGGMQMPQSDGEQGDEPQQQQQPRKRPGMKGLLQGILGG